MRQRAVINRGRDWTPFAHLVSAVVAANGTTLTLVFDRVVAGSSDFLLSVSESSNVTTCTYSSGTGTKTIVFTVGSTVSAGLSIQIRYLGAGNWVTGTVRVPAISRFPGTNNSAQ